MLVKMLEFIDLEGLITTAGYLGIFGIVFAESGLFFGFFLPGDSLLFTAGVLASQGYLNIVTLVVITFLGAVLGDSFGYYFGSHVGPRIFTREDSLLFHREHINRAQRFYEQHGAITIVLARFMPFIRTFAPILAGVGKMRYSVFLSYNLIGGFLWGVVIPSLGYFLGTVIPSIDRYLWPIIAFIIFSSMFPGIIDILRHPQSRRKVSDMIKRVFARQS
ncbi:MAG: VTT domain-containing protein [Patescibacteria group bacterium]